MFVIVDTHLPRFEALAYILPHLDAQTHLVIRLSLAFIFQTFNAEVCYSVFVNRSSFKLVCWIFVKRTYLRVCWSSTIDLCLNESSFQGVHLSKVCWKFTPSVKFYFGLNLHIFLWKMCATPGGLFSSESIVPQSKFTGELWSSASVLP